MVPKGKTGHDEDEQFFFDPEIPAIQRFIHFKATVIGRNMQELKGKEEDELDEDDDPANKALTHI